MLRKNTAFALYGEAGEQLYESEFVIQQVKQQPARIEDKLDIVR